jgi:hypothetical protein
MLFELRTLTALGWGCLSVASGCSDGRPITALHDGLAECEHMAQICREPGQRLGGRPEECHDIGHALDGKACLRAYDECAALCGAAPAGEGGGGGEGGASGAEAGALAGGGGARD